jgi:hypothetical protein
MQTGAETLEHDECGVGAAGGEGGDGGLDDDALGASGLEFSVLSSNESTS